MKITVTQDHINNGKRHNCTDCPIALALQPYGLSPSVGPRSIIWRKFNGKYNTFYKGYLPIEAQNFIQMFDCWLRS